MKESDNRKAPDFLSHETDGSQGVDSWTSNGHGVHITSQPTPEQRRAVEQINSYMDSKEKVISTDGNFFDDMLAKERKILEEFHTPEEIAEMYSAMTYAQALDIARSKKAKINYCTEYNNAYVFSYDTGEHSKGGDSPIVIMKDTGEVLNFISYAVRGGNEIVREFEV